MKEKEKSTYQLIDDQLLSLIMTWSELIDLREQYEEMSRGVMETARKLISKAEDAGIISLNDWQMINHMLWYAGTDQPIDEDWDAWRY